MRCVTVFLLALTAFACSDATGGNDQEHSDPAEQQDMSDNLDLEVSDQITGEGIQAGDIHADSSTNNDGDPGAGLVFRDLLLYENPNSVISAIVEFETSVPARCHVQYGPDGDYSLQTGVTNLSTAHAITVVNMHALSDIFLQVVAEPEEGGQVVSEELIFSAGPLPENIPLFSVTSDFPEEVAEGLTMFGPGGGLSPHYVAVDSEGQVVWYYTLDNPQSSRFNDRAIKMLDDGNLLITTPEGFNVITIGGETVLAVRASDTDFNRLHHDAFPLPDGGFLGLSEESRMVEVDWAADEVEVLGDIVVEFDATGQIVSQWNSFDHLDTNRFPTELSLRGGPDGYDWTHANAVVYLPEEDSVLVSLRHQSWVINVDWSTGEVLWRLGKDGDFDLIDSEFSDSNLWFSAQHAPELQEDGSILIFDNGNEREDSTGRFPYSRGVRYQLYMEEMNALEVWSGETEHYADFLGDADMLDNGNVLLTAGGVSAGTPAQILELTGEQDARLVWLLEVNDHTLYRALRIESLYPQE